MVPTRSLLSSALLVTAGVVVAFLGWTVAAGATAGGDGGADYLVFLAVWSLFLLAGSAAALYGVADVVGEAVADVR